MQLNFRCVPRNKVCIKWSDIHTQNIHYHITLGICTYRTVNQTYIQKNYVAQFSNNTSALYAASVCMQRQPNDASQLPQPSANKRKVGCVTNTLLSHTHTQFYLVFIPFPFLLTFIVGSQTHMKLIVYINNSLHLFILLLTLLAVITMHIKYIQVNP